MTAQMHAQKDLVSTEGAFGDLYAFLAAHDGIPGQSPHAKYFLAGPNPKDRVEVPPEVHEALLHIVKSLASGKVVTVTPTSTTLTTQQAADLLMVSRPTLVKLLDDGAIPHERISSRRTVLLADVLAYRETRRAAQFAALDATAVALADEDDPQEVAALLAEARKAVARRYSS